METLHDERTQEAVPQAPETQAPAPGQRRATGRALATVAGIVVIAVGAAVIFVAVGRDHRTTPTTTTPAAAAPAPAPAAPAAPAIAAAGSVNVSLSEFKVAPAATTIAAGNVTLNIANAGTVQHELLVFRSDLAPSAYPKESGDIDEEGQGIVKVSDGDNLDPGATQTRTVDLTQPGTYLFVCNLPGHFAAGMYQVVTVK